MFITCLLKCNKIMVVFFKKKLSLVIMCSELAHMKFCVSELALREFCTFLKNNSNLLGA